MDLPKGRTAPPLFLQPLLRGITMLCIMAMAEAAGAVLSPLVRGGRHVSFRFACDSPRLSASSFVPGAEAVEQAVEPWTGEIEQSGLPLEEGRAYRGHIWVAAQ